MTDNNLINLFNGKKLDLRKLNTEQKIEYLNLTQDEESVFRHFAGADGQFDQNEINKLQNLIYEYTYYVGDYEISSKDAKKMMKNEGLKDSANAFISLLQKMTDNENVEVLGNSFSNKDDNEIETQSQGEKTLGNTMLDKIKNFFGNIFQKIGDFFSRLTGKISTDTEYGDLKDYGTFDMLFVNSFSSNGTQEDDEKLFNYAQKILGEPTRENQRADIVSNGKIYTCTAHYSNKGKLVWLLPVSYDTVPEKQGVKSITEYSGEDNGELVQEYYTNSDNFWSMIEKYIGKEPANIGEQAYIKSGNTCLSFIGIKLGNGNMSWQLVGKQEIT